MTKVPVLFNIGPAGKASVSTLQADLQVHHLQCALQWGLWAVSSASYITELKLMVKHDQRGHGAATAQVQVPMLSFVRQVEYERATSWAHERYLLSEEMFWAHMWVRMLWAHEGNMLSTHEGTIFQYTRRKQFCMKKRPLGRHRLLSDANIKMNFSEIVLCRRELDGTVQDKLQW
jgi:hypothetical protein